MQTVRKIQTLDSQIAVPFVTCEFGGEEFGLTKSYNRLTKVRESKYVTNLTVNKKASGQVNTYQLALNYVVQPGEDPNYVDLAISRAIDRKILFSYGDMSRPEYSYKKEQAIITTVVPNISFEQHAINYTISATSSVSLSYVIQRNYPERYGKPSDIIFEQLYNNTDNGLLELFSGMRDRKKVEELGWIARNDRPVSISAVQDKSPLEYIRILLAKMSTPDGSLYAMIVHDEPDNLDGPYFEIINSTLHQGKGDHYSVDIDVGYPGDTPIFAFTPSQNTSLALITPFQGKYDKDRVLGVNSRGEPIMTSAPSMLLRNGSVKSELEQWWKSMISYPVNAVLRTRGLVKPSILCDYLHINTLFFGRRYNYSGYYMVTGQKDVLDANSGYTTELSLVRVEGDDEFYV